MIRWLYRRALRWIFGGAAPLVGFLLWQRGAGCARLGERELPARPSGGVPALGASEHAASSIATGSAPPNGAALSAGEAGLARIGWWNMRHLGEEKKDLAAVAKIVAPMSVLAIGEVMTERAPGALVGMLPGYQELHSDRSLGHGERGREWYADVFRAPGSCDAGSAVVYPDPAGAFIRPPFGVRCRVGNFDFWLVSIHVVFGKKKQLRIAEVGHLETVFRFFEDRAPPERDVVLVGDFNLDAHHHAWSELPTRLSRLVPADEKTTMGPDGHLAHHYDDVIIDRRATQEFTGRAGIVDIAAFEGASDKAAFDALSDHRPVWAEFRTDGPDDD